jgi:23S rRNA (cytosine1962-C5)-methyltransferase
MYLRTERGVGELEGLQIADGPLWGEVTSGPITIVEHELEFEVDICTGQKTGFYLDQRENRRTVASFAGGRHVLDLFCYTGAFALSAVRAGAASVLGIDTSQAAINLAIRNAVRNQAAGVQFRPGEAFEAIESLLQQSPADGGFGMVILDPPKFARQAQAIDQALRGYLSLNALAIQLLQPEGILVTCSCSGQISREQFVQVLGSAAEQTGRTLQILAQLGQAPDHPVAAACPESQYLKCFVARVT